MHKVRMETSEQYEKAIGALTKVGGTWHGVGREEKFLIVTDAQYQALVEAGVVKPEKKKGARSGAATSTHG